MSSLTKIVVSLLALYVTFQVFAGELFPSGNRLPSHLGYLKTLAEEDEKKIVIVLTGKDWNAPCKDLETDVIRTWEWSKFSHNEIVFENFDYALDGQSISKEMRHLREKFGGEGFPTFIVASADGEILGQKTGYESNGPLPLENWIRSL